MESEIERLTAENEQLKQRLYDVRIFFGSTMPFELGTPISTIIGYSDVLLNLDAENLTSDQIDYIGRIRRSARRLRHSIQIGASIGRYGIIREKDYQPILLMDLKKILPSEVGSSVQELQNTYLKAQENFSIDPQKYGIDIDGRALVASVQEIIFDLWDINSSKDVKISYSNSTAHCLIILETKLSEENEQNCYSWQSMYESGQVNWGSEKIFRLYDGFAESRKLENCLKVEIQLPLVKMDKADAE